MPDSENLIQEHLSAFRIGPWLVRPALNLLSQGETEITLEPRAMAILLMLARHAGQVVSREQLLDEAWSDVVVSDNALNQFIVKLRRALGDDAKNPHFIVTVPKKGYRLVAPVADAVLEAPRLPRSLRDKKRLLPRRPPWWSYLLVLALLAPLASKLLRELALNQGFKEKMTLTDLPGQKSGAQFSPDSRYLVFSYRQQQQPHQLMLQKLPAAGTHSVAEPVPLSGEDADRLSPSWSPDGKQLAYVWRQGHQCEIRLANLDRQNGQLTAVQRVASCHYDNTQTMVRFGKDNQTLFYNSRQSPERPYQVYRLRLATGYQVPLTNPMEPGAGDVAFFLSPGGQQLAVLRDLRWRKHEVLFLDAGSGERQLTIDMGKHLHHNGFSWAEDNRHYYLVSEPGKLERMDDYLLSQTVLADRPINQPVYDRHGDQLLVTDGEAERDIYRIANPYFTPHAKAVPVVDSDADEYAPSFASDNKTLYFVSRRSGVSQYWRLKGKLQLQLTSFSKDKHLGQLHIQGQLAISDGDDALRRFDSRDSHWQMTKMLAKYKASNPRWSRDGKHLYFASHHSGDWQIWRWNKASGKAQQITQGGGYCAQPDAREHYLYLTRVHRPGLWRMDLSNGQVSEVGTNITWQRCDGWQVAGGGIYYLTDRGEQHLHRYDLATGSIAEILDLNGNHVSQFDVSSDERQLVYTQWRQHPAQFLLLRR